jgi:hypothetical protein
VAFIGTATVEERGVRPCATPCEGERGWGAAGRGHGRGGGRSGGMA